MEIFALPVQVSLGPRLRSPLKKNCEQSLHPGVLQPECKQSGSVLATFEFTVRYMLRSDGF